MPSVLLLVLVGTFPVLDLAAALLYAATESANVGTLRLLRDVAALLLFALAVARGLVPDALRAWVALYLGLVAAYLVAALGGGNDNGLAVASAGQLALPIVLVHAGLAGIGNGRQFSRLVGCLTVLAAASAAFGAWEIGHTEWWTDVALLGEYLRDVKGVSHGVADFYELPFNFFGYDFERRAAGLLAAPLAQGSFLAVVGLVALAWYRTHSVVLAYGAMAVCTFGVYQSGTRGAMLMLAVATAVYAVLSAAAGRLRPVDWVAFAGAALVAAKPVMRIALYTLDMSDGSTEGHVDSLAGNIEDIGSVVVLGDGLGRAGAIAAQAGLEIAGGGEGALFSIAYQIGLVGAVAFLGFYVVAALQLYRRHRQPNRLGDVSRAGFALMFGAAGTLVTSEHLLTFSGMAALWFVVGGLMSAPAAVVAQEQAPRRLAAT